MINTDSYIVGGEKNTVYKILCNSQKDEIMTMRFCGKIADVSNDIFFLTHDEMNLLSHIWMSYGKHEKPISNWGAVYTPKEYRGKGYCSKTLEYSFKIIDSLANGPECLLCTAGTIELTNLYRKYGFVPAITNTDRGPLYRPVGDSPKTFREFCKEYYDYADELFVVNADFGYRNEIDCLLKFALWDLGEDFGINSVDNLAEILMKEQHRAKVIVTKSGRCVGWMLDNKTQLHPLYRHVKNLIKRP